MAVNKTIVLNNLHRTQVKIVADAAGSATITMAELVHATSGYPQILDGNPIKVSIIGASLSSVEGGPGVQITRNGVLVLNLFGNYDLPQDEVGQIKLSEEASSDIAITIGQACTLFLDLRKDSGYRFGPNVNDALLDD